MGNTPIEKSYVEQGYKLPDGWTWARVEEARTLHNTPAYMVPVATAPGCCAWAVPYIDGKPLKWRHLV